MLKRKIEQKLLEWKQNPNKVALLLKGARQIGKTTSVREFAKKNYKHFIEINFEKDRSFRSIFEGNLDARTIFLKLSSLGKGPFNKNTLVFFDEIQSCPNARTAIKFLVEDGRCDFIESGSLLGINYKDVSSYPVGFEEQLNMFPLDFEEFLWGKGISNDVIDCVKEAYFQMLPVDDFIHQQLMQAYHEFIMVGGMPKVVQTFLNNDDFRYTEKAQENILTTYRDDIAKYAEKSKDKVKAIFDAIPEQLNKKNKRFILSSIESTVSNRKYENALRWLYDAGIGYFSFNANSLELPLSFYENRSLYKLFLFDTGLLCSMSNIKSAFLTGDFSINEGALAENSVACELAKKLLPLNYYDKKSRCELDFIFPSNNKVSILEVKSGNDYKKHSSLNKVLDTYKDYIDRAIVLSKFNVERSEKISYLPFYMLMFL